MLSEGRPRSTPLVTGGTLAEGRVVLSAADALSLDSSGSSPFPLPKTRQIAPNPADSAPGVEGQNPR